VWNELYECSTEADNKLRSMFEGSSFDQRNGKVSNTKILLFIKYEILLLIIIGTHNYYDILINYYFY